MVSEKVSFPTLKPKGRVKVELMDKVSGEVVEEVSGDNFISKGMEWIYQLQMKLPFMVGRFNREGSSNTSLQTDVFREDPFNVMTLTDNMENADPRNEWHMKGNIVGNANTTTGTPGTAPLGGTINGEESFTNEDMMRIVVDFASTSANGEIGSVYFRPSSGLLANSGAMSNAVQRLFKQIRLTDAHNTDDTNVLVYENYYITHYTRNNTRSRIRVYDKDMNMKSVFEVDGGSTYDAKPSIFVKDNRLCILKQRLSTVVSCDIRDIINTENDDESIITLEDLESYSEMFSLSTIWDYNSSRYCIGMTYDNRNKRFIIALGNGSYTSSTASVYIVDDDLNVLDGYIPNMRGRIRAIYDNYVYTDNGYIDLSEKKYYNGGFYGFRCLGIDGTMISSTYADNRSSNRVANMTLHPIFGIASRYKLPAPVTKTEAHTMKITYDFIFPSIYDTEDNN